MKIVEILFILSEYWVYCKKLCSVLAHPIVNFVNDNRII